MIHLNALYDLMNHTYIDAVIQDSKIQNENKALISMIENINHKAIVTCDHNFDSYNNLVHLETKGLKYVIRIKSKVGIVKKFRTCIHRICAWIFEHNFTNSKAKK